LNKREIFYYFIAHSLHIGNKEVSHKGKEDAVFCSGASKGEIVGDGEENREVGIQVSDKDSDQPDMEGEKRKGAKVKCKND
jgi:hypothetical protein